MNENSFFDLISQYPHTLDSHLYFTAIMRDFFPKERLATNAVIACFDCGIRADIKAADKLDEYLFNRFTKLLIDNYGLKADVASCAVSTWIRVYGYNYLKKPVEESFIRSIRKYTFDDNTRGSFNGDNNTRSRQNNCSIVLDVIEDGAKLSNNLITRNEEIEHSFGISDFRISLYYIKWHGYSDAIRIVGEASMCRTKPVHVILLISIYNSKGQIIGTDFGKQIDCPLECRTQTFSTEVRIPKDETLSDIRIRPIKNPFF